MSEKQDRQGVRKASELEQKYNFGRNFDNLNGAVVAATRAATNANAAAVSANTAAVSANTAAVSANAAAEAAQQYILLTDFVITGTVTEDGSTVEMDKSFAEIMEAAGKKRKCTVVIESDGLSVFELVFASTKLIRFQQLTQEGVLVSLEISSGEE